MKLPTWVYAIGAGIALLFGSWFAGRSTANAAWSNRLEAERARAATAESLAVLDRKALAYFQATYKRDTVIETQWKIKRDTLLDSIPVDRPVPYPVFREVVRLDSGTIAACDQGRQTCELAKAAAFRIATAESTRAEAFARTNADLRHQLNLRVVKSIGGTVVVVGSAVVVCRLLGGCH